MCDTNLGELDGLTDPDFLGLGWSLTKFLQEASFDSNACNKYKTKIFFKDV